MPELALQLKEPDQIDIDQAPPNNSYQAEIIDGLQLMQKTINPKFFYDTYGSELFEQITQLPEYYPTRTERAILTHYAQEIADCCGENCVLIEPGSGSSEKVRLLLDVLRPLAYAPMDIAKEFLMQSADKLAAEFPWLDIHPLCSDFNHFDDLPETLPEGRKIAFYPGSTLGNMTPDIALTYLLHLKSLVKNDGGILIGVDLHKSTERLQAAYNDSDGITAAFNLNALEHINRLLDGNFDQDNFSHRAFYNEEERRIEMHLVSEADHHVQLADKEIFFSRGETIHTENSYKYSLESFRQLAERAGLVIRRSWVDEEELFSVHFLEVDWN